ncbi:MAG: hypothetical protein R3E84_02995 [Pseudomonadales bacterium]
MSRMALLTNNTGLLVSTVLLIAGALIIGLFALLMARAGQSLRPVLWFGGIFLLIVGPQLAGNLYKALHAGDGVVSARSGWWNRPVAAPDAPDALARLFGEEAAEAMVTDVAPMFASAGVSPRWARFVIFREGATAIIAAFDDAAAAERGMLGWLAMSGLTDWVQGDARRGFSGTRPAGDVIFTTVAGCHLGVWSAADTSALKAIVSASGFPANTHEAVIAQAGDAVVEPPPFGLSWPVASAFLFAYVLLVSFAFIKGAAWASGLPAADVPVVDVHTLRSRLLAVADTGAPVSVRALPDGATLEVEWRYSDSRWLDHAAAHAARRVHRLVLRPDAARHTVYVTDYQSALEGSVGSGGASLRWQWSTGIVFFQAETQSSVGVQLDAAGNPTGELASTWHFNLQAMKAPFQAVVRGAGWNWQPVILDVPPALDWLVR